MTYKIDVDVPVPMKRMGQEVGEERQTLESLQPNESVLFPPNRAEKARTAAVNLHSKNRSWTYMTEKQSDGSRRIWRLT